MALPDYPVYDKYGAALLRQLGSYWMYYFGDRDRLKLLLRGIGHQHGQQYLDLLNTVASLSRFDVNVFRTEDWYLLILSKSARDSVMNVYNQPGLVYNGGERYDETQSAEILYPLPLPIEFFGEFADAKYTMYNRILYPSKTWVRGLDFDIDTTRGVMRFREDPMTSDYVAKRYVYDDAGQIIDEEIGIWLYKGEFDLDEIYRRFGFAIGIQATSSEFYKGLCNAFWDSYVLGSNMAAFSQAISAMLGIPLVIEPTETVEVIREEADRKLVITDKHVYEFASTANVTVAVDDIVHAGEELTDAVDIIELNSGLADYSSVPALSFDKNFLSGGYFAALTFENSFVDIEYLGQDADGKTVITFRVQGFPADIDKFFADIQTRGKMSGQQTLAELLDLREHPITQPLPGDLPAQINPLAFILESAGRNNLTIIKVKTSAIKANTPGLQIFKHFRHIVPPHTTFIVYVEITPAADTIVLPDEVEECVIPFDGILPEDEVVKTADDADPTDASYDDLVVRVYQVREKCK